jgi:Quinohemoprotein amine dehydrogenase, alpha subunit domain III
MCRTAFTGRVAPCDSAAMKTLLGLVCGLALLGACGSNNNNNDTTDAGAITPTANGVFPSQGFIGSTLRVEISGDATNWTTGATVDLGDGVTVSNVTIASPTDLFADVAIDPTATPGLHDVTVTSGGTFKLSQAFELQSPISATIVGDLVQGTVVQLTINNLNFGAPFDASTTPVLGGPDGVNFSINSNDEFSIAAFMYIDVTASSGAITVSSGNLLATTDALTITPRTPVALTSGTAMTGMIAATRDSGLYTLTNTAGNLLHFSATTTDTNAETFVAVLPASGSWLDELPATYEVGSAGTYYAIVADDSTEANYSFSVLGASEALTTVAEGNDTTNGVEGTAPAAASLPYEQTPSTLSSAADIDIVKFTVSAADANLSAHIVTSLGSDALTDTAVELVDASGSDYLDDGFSNVIDDNSDCDLFGDCASLGEDVMSSPLPAGTYYLKVTAGASYTTADKSYSALFWLE